MEIELSNGQLKLWQWDTGQKVQVPENVPTVHFKFGSSAVEFPVTNRWADVPDELLQTGKDILIWTYNEDHTLDAARIPVEKRPKPADYVYTPTEIKTWAELDARIEALEKGGGVAGVTSVNGKTGAVTLNADDVGAVSTVNGARGAVKTAFYATAAQKGREVSVSPSPKKIYEAYAAGHSVYVKADYTIMDGLTLTLPLVLAVNYSNTYVLAFSTVGALRDNSAPMTPVVSFDGNAWRMWITEGVKSDDKLPNPEELVVPLNGTKYTYDGRYMLQLPEINTKSLNVTGAAVGQTVKISAVDDNGVPTAWVPVDMASGGGGEWNTIVDTTLTESAAYNQEVQLAGYHEVVVYFRLPKVESVIQLGNSYSPVGQAGLYYGKIGDTAYPWVYRSHAWCDANGNIIDSIMVTGAEGGTGMFLNIRTQATSWKKIYNSMHLDKELPAGTQIWIKAR